MKRDKEIEKDLKEMKKEKKGEDIKKEIFKELKSFWFWFYVIGMILFATILNLKISLKTINIGCLIGLLLVQLIHNLKVKSDDKRLEWLKWVLFGTLILLSVIYTSAILNEFIITGISLLISFCIIFAWVITISFKNMWNSKNVPQIILNYIVFAFTLILFFGAIYITLSAWDTNQITDKENNSIKGTWNFVYFSASVFYTNVIEHFPTGYSRLIVIIELATSFIIHIILLGSIIPTIQENFNKINRKND